MEQLLKPLAKTFAVASIVALAGFASAQDPDVRFKVDLLFSYRTGNERPVVAKFYDALGHFSTVGLTFFVETGFKVFVSEKLQGIDNDPDVQLLDEYYVEDEGLWRVGKQYLPFGRGLVHESVVAARGDTSLIFEGVPVAAAVCDAGQGRQRGVIGRIGSNLGVSFAFGEHFGINGTALALVRRVERSPGIGAGWQRMFGIDYSQKHKLWSAGAEIVSLQAGELASQGDSVVADVSGTYTPKKGISITAGWSRDFDTSRDFYRLLGAFTLSKGIIFEPILRLRNDRLYDLSIGVHLKF